MPAGVYNKERSFVSKAFHEIDSGSFFPVASMYSKTKGACLPFFHNLSNSFFIPGNVNLHDESCSQSSKTLSKLFCANLARYKGILAYVGSGDHKMQLSMEAGNIFM